MTEQSSGPTMADLMNRGIVGGGGEGGGQAGTEGALTIGIGAVAGVNVTSTTGGPLADANVGQGLSAMAAGLNTLDTKTFLGIDLSDLFSRFDMTIQDWTGNIGASDSTFSAGMGDYTSSSTGSSDGDYSTDSGGGGGDSQALAGASFVETVSDISAPTGGSFVSHVTSRGDDGGGRGGGGDGGFSIG